MDAADGLSGGMIANLLADHEAVIQNLRARLVTVMDKHGGARTSDFLTKHEKMAWMLRAFLDGPLK